MKEYKDKLTVTENMKGVLDADTIKGCIGVNEERPKGCYDLCYACKIAKSYGYDFGKPVNRKIKSREHLLKLLKEINENKLPFFRIGVMGGPSTDWNHTIKQLKYLSISNKTPVIITKHWKTLTDKQMKTLGELDVVLNTSISPLDTKEERKHRLKQYNRYKKYGISVIRIVSINPNLDSDKGKKLNKIQKELFENENIIDNPLRLNKKYPLYVEGVIKAKKVKDLNSKVLISKLNKDTYVGKCINCPEQCGLKYKWS